MSAPQAAGRDRPWVFRTYSGHSSARASNELYRLNLATLWGLTSKDGQFKIVGPAGKRGDLNIHVFAQQDGKRLFGSAEADIGATDVRIEAKARG